MRLKFSTRRHETHALGVGRYKDIGHDSQSVRTCHSVLRSKNFKTWRAEMPTDSNFEGLTRLVKSLAMKIYKLDSDSQSRHDVLCVKLQQLKSKAADLSGEIKDFKQILKFTTKEVETVKNTLGKKVDSAWVAILERKLVDDLENRSKRNNIVIRNIPEGV